jgi:hypothetical protein
VQKRSAESKKTACRFWKTARGFCTAAGICDEEARFGAAENVYRHPAAFCIGAAARFAATERACGETAALFSDARSRFRVTGSFYSWTGKRSSQDSTRSICTAETGFP